MLRARSLSALVVAVLAICSVSGCDTKLEKPPVEVSYRPSLVGAGKILRIKNLSQQTLRGLEITIRAERGEVSHREDELAGFGVLEVGWKKLGGFEIPDRASVAVRADGYLIALEVDLDATVTGGGNSG